MKKLSIILCICGFCSCMSVKQIGNINMISTRNVDSNASYALISTYSGGSERELKKSRSKTIEDAINNTVKSVPGGEFLKNVKIYFVNSQYYAVEGDVWGTPGTITFKGFKVGDKVTWKNKKPLFNNDKRDFLTGQITALKNDKECIVKITDEENIVELSYEVISKTQ